MRVRWLLSIAVIVGLVQADSHNPTSNPPANAVDDVLFAREDAGQATEPTIETETQSGPILMANSQHVLTRFIVWKTECPTFWVVSTATSTRTKVVSINVGGGARWLISADASHNDNDTNKTNNRHQVTNRHQK